MSSPALLGAINVATYIGFKTGRTVGAVVATLGVILPSFCAIMIVVEVLRGIGDNEYVSGALAGFRAAAAGLIAYAAFGVSANVIKNVFAALSHGFGQPHPFSGNRYNF